MCMLVSIVLGYAGYAPGTLVHRARRGLACGAHPAATEMSHEMSHVMSHTERSPSPLPWGASCRTCAQPAAPSAVCMGHAERLPLRVRVSSVLQSSSI